MSCTKTHTGAVIIGTPMFFIFKSVACTDNVLPYSKFYDSDSVAFGIETVVVLLVSVTSAYCIGFALSSLLLGQVMLVVKPMSVASSSFP